MDDGPETAIHAPPPPCGSSEQGVQPSGSYRRKRREKESRRIDLLRNSTTDEVCEVLGVTRPTITRYRGLGMPGRSEGRRWFYDLDECRAWVARFIGGNRRGGSREGAGRPSTRSSIVIDEGNRDAEQHHRPSRRTPASTREQIAGVDLEDALPAEVQLAKLIEEIRLLRIDRAQTEARLVDMQAAREALSRTTAKLENSLRGMGASLAMVIIERLGADPAKADAVRQIIDEQLDHALDELRGVFDDGGKR